SLDQPFDEAGDLVLADVLKQMTVPSAEEDVMSVFLKERLDQFLDQLSPMESKVLRHRFGLDGEQPLTLREVGDKVNLSRERIRQIEVQALKKLRDSLKETSLANYLN